MPLPAAPANSESQAGSGSEVVPPAVAQDPEATVITQRGALTPISSAADGQAPPQGSAAPGQRLGHFELGQYIGGGGMGRVFRAVDTSLGRTVALKVLSPDQAADPNTLLRFQNEAQSTARLEHPNVAQVYYLGEDRGIPFIVFEYVEGMNVRELVQKKGPLPLAEAVSYVLQVADALTHAAERNVVHRDIKPSNVLVTADGVAKLIDLGLARLQRTADAGDDLTASGVTLGTFDYISPEQARDPRNADVRSDIYSLGCTFFYMLTAQPPFPEGTVLQKLLQHQGDQPPEVRQFRPDLSEEVARVLRRMLAKDPRQRYQKPAHLVADLAHLAAGVGLKPARSGARVWVATHGPRVFFWERHLPWVAPIVVLICAVALLDWFTSRSEEAMPPPAPAVNPAPSAAPLSPPAGRAEATMAGPPKVLIVGTHGPGEADYPSLAAACAAARDDSVVELRFSGPRLEQPIVLTNRKLTIRAGDKYQPVIRFEPAATPEKAPQAMISLAGGQLTLSNLGLECDIPEGVAAADWTLLETPGADLIRMELCTLRFRNASPQTSATAQGSAFVRLRAPALSATAPRTAAAPATAIELENCIAIGEAAFLQVQSSQGFRLTWNNGLLATSECLVSCDSGPEPAAAGTIRQVKLDHVTADMRRGLCRITAAQPAMVPLDIVTANDIFVGRPGVPLIVQTGAASVENGQRGIKWRAQHNFYEGWDVFWSIGSADPKAAPELMPFDLWKAYWETREERPTSNGVVWKKRPDPDRPAHDQSPADYRLSDEPGNPARTAASDGEAVGFRAALLPPLPPAEG